MRDNQQYNYFATWTQILKVLLQCVLFGSLLVFIGNVSWRWLGGFSQKVSSLELLYMHGLRRMLIVEGLLFIQCSEKRNFPPRNLQKTFSLLMWAKFYHRGEILALFRGRKFL